ncbi:unnamed protein product [Rhodiola kirilowii]
MEPSPSFKSLELSAVTPSGVAYLRLNRPAQRNALSQDFFAEFPKVFSLLDQNPKVRVIVIVLSGAGHHFCAGIDISTLGNTTSRSDEEDRGRSAERLRREIKYLQDAITAIENERCRKPVIATVHGACIGGGIDVITACDVRYCTEDAFFSVKEVDLAIVADLGTLQRLPSIIGYGNAMELALTGRRFTGVEAKALGLVAQVFKSGEEMAEGVRAIEEGKAG